MIKKIKDNKGITIIHAIIGIMLLTMLSSVIFVSSMSNMKSYQAQKKYQQAYLTVSSAMDVFVDSLQGDSVFYTIVYTRTPGSGEYVKSQPTWSYEDVNLKNELRDFDNAGRDAFMAAYQLMYDHYDDEEDTFSVEKTYKIRNSMIPKAGSSTSNVWGSVVPIVVVDVQYKDYWIYANFSIEDAEANYNYFMCVQIPVTKSLDSETTDASGNITRKYRLQIADWDSIKISKGAFQW